MKKYRSLVFLAIILFINLISAQDTFNSMNNTNKTCIYFFYGSGCPHCARVEPFVEQIVKNYSLDIHSYEIYYNRSNLLLMHQFFDRYNVSIQQRGIPVVFIGDTYFLGDEPILQNLDEKVKSLQRCPLNVTNATGIFGPFSGFSPNEASITVITLAALVDSVNPCAMAVLLILLALLMSTGDKSTALRSGVSFIISIFIVYLLFGFGIFKVIQIAGLSFWFYKGVGALALIIGVLGIRDYFVPGEAGSSVPNIFRPFLRKILAGVTNPVGAFIAGIFVTLFELPCTGGPYLYVLGMLAEKATEAIAIPILIYYNIIFILPLVLILALVLYGFTTTEKAQQWKEKNMKKIGLIAGIIMILLGIFVLIK